MIGVCMAVNRLLLQVHLRPVAPLRCCWSLWNRHRCHHPMSSQGAGAGVAQELLEAGADISLIDWLTIMSCRSGEYICVPPSIHHVAAKAQLLI